MLNQQRPNETRMNKRDRVHIKGNLFPVCNTVKKYRKPLCDSLVYSQLITEPLNAL